MKAQVSMISIVIIAGIIVALIAMAYVWAVPMIEKRVTVTDYNVARNFILELNEEIVDIANSGSGSATLAIPTGELEIRGYDFSGIPNNTITLDFFVSQPIMIEGGQIPVETSSLDDIGEYGSTEPRIIMFSRSFDDLNTHLNITMRYRELRSNVPKGYVIALCPSTGCDSILSGVSEITVSYDRIALIPRDQFAGGDLSIIYLTVAVG
jgi:hypothetical protein